MIAANRMLLMFFCIFISLCYSCKENYGDQKLISPFHGVNENSETVTIIPFNENYGCIDFQFNGYTDLYFGNFMVNDNDIIFITDSVLSISICKNFENEFWAPTFGLPWQFDTIASKRFVHSNVVVEQRDVNFEMTPPFEKIKLDSLSEMKTSIFVDYLDFTSIENDTFFMNLESTTLCITSVPYFDTLFVDTTEYNLTFKNSRKLNDELVYSIIF